MAENPRDFDELDEWVLEEDNLVTVSGVGLRNAAGWSRMTEGTVAFIEDELKKRALGCFPRLSADRHAEFRIYKKGSPLGNLIEAVLQPTDSGDKLLRESSSGAAQEILRKIERLVCTR